MANITTTEAANAIPTIVAAQALGYLKANTVFAMLVTRDWDDDVAHYGQTVKIPWRGTLIANAKAVNTAVTLQNPSDTAVTVTLNKHKEVTFLLEDFTRAFTRPDYLQGYIEDGCKVLAEQLDADLAGLYASYSQTINASTGLNEGNIREARRLLNAAKAPMMDRVAIVDEDTEKELLGIEKLINRDYRRIDEAPPLQNQADMLSKFHLGSFAGFDIYLDQMIQKSGGNNQNFFMHKNAMVLVTRPLPPAPENAGVRQVVMNEYGLGLRVTMSYSPNFLGVQITIDLLYGVAALRTNHGVIVQTLNI